LDSTVGLFFSEEDNRALDISKDRFAIFHLIRASLKLPLAAPFPSLFLEFSLICAFALDKLPFLSPAFSISFLSC